MGLMGPQVDISDSFGEYLRRERESRDINLEEIASYTRIKLKALEAIEEDDFASLPPLAFVRAFIRCYSDYVGLNVPDVMLRFDSFVQNRYPELTGEAAVIHKRPAPKQRYLLLGFMIIAVLVGALAFWLANSPDDVSKKTDEPRDRAGLYSGSSLPTTDEIISGGGTTEEPGDSIPATDETPDPVEENGVSTPAAGASPDQPEPNEPPAREPIVPKYPWISRLGEELGPPKDLCEKCGSPPSSTGGGSAPPETSPATSIRHRVVLSLEEACWVSFSIDGEDPPRQAILNPEENPTVAFEASRSLRLALGNPDGVSSVQYNGKPYDYNPNTAPWIMKFPPGGGD